MTVLVFGGVAVGRGIVVVAAMVILSGQKPGGASWTLAGGWAASGIAAAAAAAAGGEFFLGGPDLSLSFSFLASPSAHHTRTSSVDVLPSQPAIDRSRSAYWWKRPWCEQKNTEGRADRE